MGRSPLLSPAIPPRTSLRTKETRRKSLPASTSTLKEKQQCPASSVNVQPASAEIISSLISTLSAISSPAEHHFNSLPAIATSRSTPVSPRACESHHPFPLVCEGDDYFTARAGFGPDGALPIHRHCEGSQLDPDSTGIVTSRQATLRRQSSKESRGIRVRSHIGSEGADSDGCSIGKVSIEPGGSRSSTSIISTTGGRLKGMRSYKDLKFSLSNDRIQEGKGRLWIPEASQQVERLSPLPKGRLRLSDSSVLSDTSSAGPSSQPSPIRIPKRSSSARHSSATTEIDARSLDSTTSPTSTGNGRHLPTRDSSMRHSFSASPARRERSLHRSDQSICRSENRLPVNWRPDFPEQELPQVMDDLVEEDEVTRRIRELKDQKRMRDHELTVAAPEWQLFSKSPTLSPKPKPVPNGVSQNEDVTRTPSPVDTADIMEPNIQNSAPSPAISQRADRKNGQKIKSMVIKTTTTSSAGQNATSSKMKASPPQRSNSRLLRRLSRPLSPTTAEKHRRTFSGGFSPPRTPVEDRPKSQDVIDQAVQDFLTAPRLSQSIRDPQTDRIISFSEVGDPTGSAVFCCVGMGLTRYVTAFYDELASTLRLRLITPDRPGVGASEAHVGGLDTPLAWPDDVRAICQHLNLTKFSILAHSAGAIYALATALRMPQHIRGRIHLLAPWIPPSQMSAFGSQQEALPASALPYSQRFLRSLPATFLKAANSNWLSATSASVTSKSPRRSKRKNRDFEAPDGLLSSRGVSPSPLVESEKDRNQLAASASKDKENLVAGGSDVRPSLPNRTSSRFAEKDRQPNYDTRLTEGIWDRATTDANPAVDLIVCLERRQSIGFRYVDIKKPVVIHHGSRDTRVPLENVKWLGKTMRKCEVRVLEGEGHGLMASAAVMGNILMEISREWEDWIRVTRGRSGLERRVTAVI